jgi:hypothetical protein
MLKVNNRPIGKNSPNLQKFTQEAKMRPIGKNSLNLQKFDQETKNSPIWSPCVLSKERFLNNLKADFLN